MIEIDSNQTPLVDYPKPQPDGYVVPAFNANMIPEQQQNTQTGTGVINAYAKANQAISEQNALNPNPYGGSNDFNINTFEPNVSRSSVDAVKKALSREAIPDQLTREDYYPGMGLPTQQGSGSDIIGSYNTYASHDIIPVGLINAYKLAKQKKAAENAKMAEYKQELYDVKDSIINNNWIPTQIRTTQDLLQKFKDKYGNEAGAILAKDSPELKMLTQQFRTRTKAFNDYFEEATNTVLQYEAGKLATITDKEGGKNDSEVIKTQGGAYVSKFMYDKAKNWLSHMTNPDLTVQDIMQYNPNDFATGKNMESVVQPVATQLSKRALEWIAKDYGKNTNSNMVYSKFKQTGFTKEQNAELDKEADNIWERGYSNLPKNAQPTKQEVRTMLRQYTTYQVEQDLRQVSLDTYAQHKAIDKKYDTNNAIIEENKNQQVAGYQFKSPYFQRFKNGISDVLHSGTVLVTNDGRRITVGEQAMNLDLIGIGTVIINGKEVPISKYSDPKTGLEFTTTLTNTGSNSIQNVINQKDNDKTWNDIPKRTRDLIDNSVSAGSRGAEEQKFLSNIPETSYSYNADDGVVITPSSTEKGSPSGNSATTYTTKILTPTKGNNWAD